MWGVLSLLSGESRYPDISVWFLVSVCGAAWCGAPDSLIKPITSFYPLILAEMYICLSKINVFKMLHMLVLEREQLKRMWIFICPEF